jgi:mutator family transposase
MTPWLLASCTIRRRSDVVGIFPNRDALIRLVGAVLAKQHEEWIEGRRYLGLEVLKRARVTAIPDPATTSDEFKAKIISALRRLQRMPKIVRAFFADPDLRYITA